MPRQALGAWLLLVFSLHAPGMLCPLAAQEAGPASYVHRAWTAEDGLPQNSVTALARTQDGYLWVGTLKGLARFDGMHFITFEAATTEGLESDRISSLLEDHTGTLWIRTEEGRLSSYWAGHFTAYADMGVVLRLYEDQQGVLWIGTSNGLLRREGTRLTRFTMQDGLPGNRTSALMEDRAGTLWILTDGGLVQRKNGRFTVPPLLVGEAVSALAEQADGSLWLNTKGGIRHISNDQVADYPLPGLSIRDLVVGRSDRVWVLTNGQGLLHFTGQGFAPFDMQEEVAGTTVHALLEDEDGLLWVGTRSSGLHRFQERLFNAYTQDDGLPADVIHAVMEDRQGAIWAGTYDGGVARLAEGRITIYSAKEGLPNNSIFAISEDREGTIWATSSGHAFAHFDGSRFVVPPPATTHATQRGRGIAAAFVPGHTLWQIHKEGVFQQRNEALTQVLDYSFQPLPWPLFEDHKGRLWLNHSERLCYVEQEQLICPVEQGATAPIRTLHEPADDTYWLGTYGSGLCQLRHTQLTCLNKMHGLPDNTVHRILEDDFGYVWLSSNKGIARIARRDLMAFFDGSANRIYPDLYGTADGMPSNECNGGTYPAGWKARDGRLWFPTMKGLAVVDPTRALQQATRPPPVHIENVSVDGVVVSSMEAGDPVLPAGRTGSCFATLLPTSRLLRNSGFGIAWRDTMTYGWRREMRVQPHTPTLRPVGISCW